jgi:hypothetical protein
MGQISTSPILKSLNFQKTIVSIYNDIITDFGKKAIASFINDLSANIEVTRTNYNKHIV